MECKCKMAFCRGMFEIVDKQENNCKHTHSKIKIMQCR